MDLGATKIGLRWMLWKSSKPVSPFILYILSYNMTTTSSNSKTNLYRNHLSSCHHFLLLKVKMLIYSCVVLWWTEANKTGCPKKKRRYVTKKNYGKLPVYLETRIRTAAEIKKRDSPEEQAKCRHDGTRKYISITLLTATKPWNNGNVVIQILRIFRNVESHICLLVAYSQSAEFCSTQSFLKPYLK
jgi:hypothetical protein